MNLLAIVNRLKVEAGRSGGVLGSVDTAGVEDARLVGWARDAWLVIENDREWSWQRKAILLGAIVDGQAEYTAAQLDAAVVDWRSWWKSDDVYKPTVYPAGLPTQVSELSFVPYDVFRRNFVVTPHAPGTPQFWTVTPAGKLAVGPTPLGAWKLQIDYRAKPDELLLDADVPAAPEEHHMIVVWKALIRVGSFDAAPELVDQGQTEYLRMHSDLKRDCGPQWRRVPTPIA